jgi:integrase
LPKLKLTNTTVERIKAPDKSGKQTLHWDTELKGFAVLASGKTNAKTFVVQRTLPNGRDRRMTVGSVHELSLDTAREQAADLLHQMRTADPKVQRRVNAVWTLKHGFAEYLKARKALRPSTIKFYRGIIEAYLSDWLDLPLAGITPAMVQDKHREIQAEVARRHGAKHQQHWQSVPGGHVANKAMSLLGMVWNFAELQQPSLPRNPTRILERQLYAEPRRERHVTGDQMPRFYAAVEGLESGIARDFIKLCLFTGLRLDEAQALRWDEVDFTTRTINLPATRTKPKRPLNLPMCNFVRELLIARRALGNAGGWVFPGGGVTGHLTYPYKAFTTISETSGIKVSPHDLRRTYISHAEACDISPLALKALVNHATGDVTAGYVMIDPKRLAEAAQKVGDRLCELCGITAPEGVARLGA